MGQQVKVPADVKRELELVAGITGKTQGELVAAAWDEYRERHKEAFREGLRWAQSTLSQPLQASVAASGMPPEDIAEIADALGDVAPSRTTSSAKS